ncbi:MAG: hypothetical protein OXP73_06730, partial [Chloroflexota bacterium]|nr:hypothetical protein [Chloroflexota bacterium]
MSWRTLRLVAARLFIAGLALAGEVTLAAEGNAGAARPGDAETAGGATGETGATTTSSAAPGTFWEALGSVEAIRAFAAGLSDDELLGQAFMLGYPDAALTPFLLGWIEGQGLGGVK